MKKLLITLLFLIIFPRSVYAVVANFQVTGLVQTSDSRVMPGSTVVFFDKSGKEIASSLTGPDGRYQAMLPEGEYAVTVKAPNESKLSDIKFSGQIVNSDSSRDFTFNTGKAFVPVTQNAGSGKKFGSGKSVPLIALAIIFVVALILVVLKKFKKGRVEDSKSI